MSGPPNTLEPATSQLAPAAARTPALSVGDAAVDLDGDVLRQVGASTRDLVRRGLDEALPAEPGVHRHDHHEVAVVARLGERLDGRRRVEGDAGGDPGLADLPSTRCRCTQASWCTVMTSAPAAANWATNCSGRSIMRCTSSSAPAPCTSDCSALSDQRSDGDVGHEVAVHDVDVDDARAGVEHRLDVVAQTAEVGGQDRRCDVDVAQYVLHRSSDARRRGVVGRAGILPRARSATPQAGDEEPGRAVDPAAGRAGSRRTPDARGAARRRRGRRPSSPHRRAAARRRRASRPASPCTRRR